MTASRHSMHCRCLVFSAAQAATLPYCMADASAQVWKYLGAGAVVKTSCASLRQPVCTVVEAAAVCTTATPPTAQLNVLSGFHAGGGFGYVSRAYGLACDTIAEVEVVLADGTVVIANANNNSDLLWASQGELSATRSVDVNAVGWSTQPHFFGAVARATHVLSARLSMSLAASSLSRSVLHVWMA